MIRLRSFIFNVLFYLALIVLMIGGLPVVLRGRHGVFALARVWGDVSLWLLEKVCGLRVEFRGLQNIPTGGYIIAAKHQSFLETFALLKYAPDFAYVLKRELTYIPAFGLYLIVAEQIAINRARGRDAMTVLSEQAAKVLKGGRQVFIFPEGTRRPPGAPPQYRPGVSRLYADSGAPCLPVALNTGVFWPRRSSMRYPGVAVIEYLPPIAPGLTRQNFLDTLQSKIESACDRLNAEAATSRAPATTTQRNANA
jgi:1-acyl-sn-glycerol-3-phosphate acyltransferase